MILKIGYDLKVKKKPILKIGYDFENWYDLENWV
jgi:hypothetical protein